MAGLVTPPTYSLCYIDGMTLGRAPSANGVCLVVQTGDALTLNLDSAEARKGQ